VGGKINHLKGLLIGLSRETLGAPIRRGLKGRHLEKGQKRRRIGGGDVDHQEAIKGRNIKRTKQERRRRARLRLKGERC